jgi:hypothetical protein
MKKGVHKMNEIAWQLYPCSRQVTPLLKDVIDVFETNSDEISSDCHELRSDDVLAILQRQLIEIGFNVETSKKEKICVPVLFGRNGIMDKHFDADAYHSDGVVLEVEAGRAVDNHNFLKDLFQAIMMQNVKQLIICVRKDYRGSDNFETICRWFATLYASERLTLPLDSILIIGY